MPTIEDWKKLYKKVNSYGGQMAEIWGLISENNIVELMKKKYRSNHLFDILVRDGHFAEANTVAYFINIFADIKLSDLLEKHRLLYLDVVKSLIIDDMILLFENFYNKFYKDHDDIFTEGIDEDFYRKFIAKKYENYIVGPSSTNDVIELIDNFTFINHIYMDNFYDYCKVIARESKEIESNNSTINSFVIAIDQYKLIVPLIHHFINEYHLQYIQQKVSDIQDILDYSKIIICEQIDEITKFITNMNDIYVDFRYKNIDGCGIIHYISMIPLIDVDHNRRLYSSLFEKDSIDYTLTDSHGNNFLHYAANNNNKLLFDIFIEKIKFNKELIKNILSIDNNKSKNIIDILILTEQYAIIVDLINYLPAKSKNKLLSKFVNGEYNPAIFNKIDPECKLKYLYIETLQIIFSDISEMNRRGIYDKLNYTDKIDSCYNLLNHIVLSDSDNIYESDHIARWLILCIENNLSNIFELIINKFFFNMTDPKQSSYLNNIYEPHGTIIHSAVKSCRINMVKILCSKNVDILTEDSDRKNVIFVALETNNVDLLELLLAYSKLRYNNHVKLLENYLNLIRQKDFVNEFNFDYLRKIFNTLLYYYKKLFAQTL